MNRLLNSSNDADTVTLGLTLVSTYAKLCSNSGRHDFNKDCEDFVCQLLNEVYGLSLVNVNRISMNYPSVDLGDSTARVSYQVTATRDRQKIQTTLDRFSQHGLQTMYDSIYVLILTEKRNYTREFTPPEGIGFSVKENIIDLLDLQRAIVALSPAKRAAVACLIRKEIPVLERLSRDGTEDATQVAPDSSGCIAGSLTPDRALELLKRASFRFKAGSRRITGIFVTEEGHALAAWEGLRLLGDMQTDIVEANYRSVSSPLRLRILRDLSDKQTGIAVLKVVEPKGMAFEFISAAWLPHTVAGWQRADFWRGRKVYMFGFPARRKSHVEPLVYGRVVPAQEFGTADAHMRFRPEVETRGLRIEVDRAETLIGLIGAAVLDVSTGCVLAIQISHHEGSREASACELAPMVGRWRSPYRGLISDFSVLPEMTDSAVDLFISELLQTQKAQKRECANEPSLCTEDSARYALDRYFHRLRNKHNVIQVLGQSAPKPLTRIYTDVNILRDLSAWHRADTPQERENLVEVFWEERGFENLQQRERGIDVVRFCRRLFVFGRPGAGKTTFLKYLALESLSSQLNRIPIFIPLQDYDRSEMSLQEYIVKQFEGCGLENPETFVEMLLDSRRALVLFDGLDEISSGSDRRQGAISELVSFGDRYDSAQIIITCRVAATEYQFVGYDYVEMADFDDAQIMEFVSNWYVDQPSVRDRFMREFTSEKRLDELSQTPLLLTMLCIAFEANLRFPSTRTSLYEDALDVLLRKWDVSRGIPRHLPYRDLDVRWKHQMFAAIAEKNYNSLEGPKIMFRQRDLEREIEKHLSKLPRNDSNAPIDAHSVLKSVEEQHGIFVERAKGIYSFSHLTFQEYYTARHIVDNAHYGALQRMIKVHCTDDRWRHVFLLTAEMLGDADAFFHWFNVALWRLVEEDEVLSGLVDSAERFARNRTSRSPQISPPIIRAVIIGLVVRVVHAGCLRFPRERAIELARTLDVARYYHMSRELRAAIGKARDTELRRELAKHRRTRRQESHTHKLVNELKHKWDKEAPIPDEIGLAGALDHTRKAIITLQRDNIRENCEAPTEAVFEKLLRTKFGLPRDWAIAVDRISLLAIYIEASQLLVECLKNACVSNRVGIEDRLLTRIDV